MSVKSQDSGVVLLEKRIESIKYSLFCLSGLMWLIGAAVFALAIWLRADTELSSLIEALKIYEFYMGPYILISAAVLVIVIAVYGCAASLIENYNALRVNAGLQAICFILALAGTAVLMDYSTNGSKIQPLVRNSMYGLIRNSHIQHDAYILQSVQGGIGCCGAKGPRDYMIYRRELPAECRDSLTGNVFPYGCDEGVTWYLESRTSWIGGLGLMLCLTHVIQAILSLLLVSALKKEEESFK